ncbi:MAG: heme-binding protein [Verrucomicrobia bacterium]|nr:heme-binding protein [Verrucomicrobiota bacterium]MDA1065629.1 heme-binding protein [Verrucomicrobiota bacterium]
MLRYLIPLILIIQSPFIMAYEKAFEPTEPGITELKELPSGRLLEARGDGSYFDSSNSLFRPLFQYIQKNDIAMTTPVEARMDPGAMYFWVSSAQEEKASSDAANVRVIDVPKRTVVAHGSRGSYSQNNFEKAKVILLEWVDSQEEMEAVGEPFAVYWDGPFTPWFLKTFEVQVEVRPKNSEAASS